MLISEKLETTMNQQVTNEYGASLQYVSIAGYFDSEDLPELSAFFFKQAEEEKMHALKIAQYILDAGGQVRISAIPATRYEFQAAEDAVQAALDWEVEVTSQINNLMSIAVDQKDYIAQDFLNWFVREQLEEVSTMSTLLNIVRRAGENLFYVEEYVARTGHPEDAAANGSE